MKAAGDEGESLYDRIRQNRQRMKPRDERIYDIEDDSETGYHDHIPGGSDPRMEGDAARFSDDQDPQQGSQFSPATRNVGRIQQSYSDDSDGEEPPSQFSFRHKSPAEGSGTKGHRADEGDEADDDSFIESVDIRPPRTRGQRGGFQAYIERRHDLDVQREPQDHWEGTPSDTENVEGSYFDDYGSDEEEQGAFRKGDDFQWASNHPSPKDDYWAGESRSRVHGNFPKSPRKSDAPRLKPLKGFKHRR